MPEVRQLGRLVTHAPGLGVQPSSNFNAISNPSISDLSDSDVAAKAVADAKEIPSIWFVNFPSPTAVGQPKLQAYMQSVQDYRCWASLLWWKTVYGQSAIPQDGSQASISARSAYCARVGVHHMKTTPCVDQNLSKTVECSASQFHIELITAVMSGFVGISPAAFTALETLLNSLAKTINQSSSTSENKLIVCERYEYLAQSDTIRSYVHLVSFAVTEDMRNVSSGKSSSQWVKCEIDYNEYEADFNQKSWAEVSASLGDSQKKAATDFINNSSIDCPP